eukprot:3311519-Rhodomonas_salina.2
MHLTRGGCLDRTAAAIWRGERADEDRRSRRMGGVGEADGSAARIQGGARACGCALQPCRAGRVGHHATWRPASAWFERVGFCLLRFGWPPTTACTHRTQHPMRSCSSHRCACSLGKWVVRQRRKWRQGALGPDRVLQLQALGLSREPK